MSETPKAPGLFPDLEALTAAWTSALLPAGTGGGPAELAARLLDPRQWLGVGGAALEQPFETVLGLPRLADVPELDRKLLRLMQAWTAVAQRGAEYGAVVSQVWVGAYADFVQALQAAAADGKPARSGRELLDRWTATVNERLVKAQRRARVLDAHRRPLAAPRRAARGGADEGDRGRAAGRARGGGRDSAQAGRRARAPDPHPRRGREDRHHAQGRGAADRQDGPLPLPAAGRGAVAGAGA